MDKGIWVQSNFQEENEVLYFFHPVEGGGGQAYVSISNDGTIEFSGYHRKVVIKNIATENEKVVIEAAADVVV